MPDDLRGDLRIGDATADDVPDLLRLIQALAEYEHLTPEVQATEDRLRASLFGGERVAHAVLARVKTEAIGFAVWFRNYSTFLARPGVYLEDVFVVPAWRGRGVGRRLLAHVASVAEASQAGRMEWAVLNWNEPALRLYRGVGARPMDGWTTYRLTGDALRALALTAGQPPTRP